MNDTTIAAKLLNQLEWVHREIYAETSKFTVAFSMRIYYNICHEKQIFDKGPFPR